MTYPMTGMNPTKSMSLSTLPEIYSISGKDLVSSIVCVMEMRLGFVIFQVDIRSTEWRVDRKKNDD